MDASQNLTSESEISVHYGSYVEQSTALLTRTYCNLTFFTMILKTDVRFATNSGNNGTHNKLWLKP